MAPRALLPVARRRCHRADSILYVETRDSPLLFRRPFFRFALHPSLAGRPLFRGRLRLVLGCLASLVRRGFLGRLRPGLRLLLGLGFRSHVFGRLRLGLRLLLGLGFRRFARYLLLRQLPMRFRAPFRPPFALPDRFRPVLDFSVLIVRHSVFPPRDEGLPASLPETGSDARASSGSIRDESASQRPADGRARPSTRRRHPARRGEQTIRNYDPASPGPRTS